MNFYMINFALPTPSKHVNFNLVPRLFVRNRVCYYTKLTRVVKLTFDKRIFAWAEKNDHKSEQQMQIIENLHLFSLVDVRLLGKAYK